MRRMTVWVALVILLLGIAAPELATAQPAGTIVVGLVAEPVNLDPAQVTDLNSNRVGRRIVETLVTLSRGEHADRARPRGVVDDLEGRPHATPSSCARASRSTTARRSTPRP